MAIREHVFPPANSARHEVSRPAGIPWWALICTVILVLLLLAIWSTPIWADFGRNPVQPAHDEVPGWIVILLILGALAGVRELVTSR
ncbi:MAG: hypothetical protein RML36_03100 [Anaerolineae bacterium]|nr:hypothetical protein [Anaerolineae bacterium]MDW8098455.1 hypothetical protein [Anaerolineae bacterium]